MSDISAFKALNAGLEPLIIDLAVAAKNGKNVAKDLPLIVDLVKHFPVIAEGVKAIKEISPEVKTLDAATIAEIGKETFDMVTRIVAAVKAA